MLFKKIFFFAVLIIAAEQLVCLIFIKKQLPEFWGNEELTAKLQYLHKHPEVNTVFVGSSKVKTQVIPGVFDSVTGNKTTSFNLGCNGLFIPESFKLLDHLLDSTHLKTILFEVRPIYHIYTQNLHISRSIYYHSVSNYAASLQNAWHSNLPLPRKLSTWSTFSIAEAENLLNFNLAEGYISYKNFKLDSLQKVYVLNAGCLPRGEGINKTENNPLRELDAFAKISLQYMSKFNTDSFRNITCNKTYLEEMQRILKKAAEKKVRMILLFPSAVREFEYLEVLPLLRELPGTPQFIMADAARYPELYKAENNYESDHLNKSGSVIYSTKLANEYNRLLQH